MNIMSPLCLSPIASISIDIRSCFFLIRLCFQNMGNFFFKMSIFLDQYQMVYKVFYFGFLYCIKISKSMDKFRIFDILLLWPKSYSNFLGTPFRFPGPKALIVIMKKELYHNIWPLR